MVSGSIGPFTLGPANVPGPMFSSGSVGGLGGVALLTSEASAFVGRLADLRGPAWPKVIVPTHVVTDVAEVWLDGGFVWRVVAHAFYDGRRCVHLMNRTHLARRCV